MQRQRIIRLYDTGLHAPVEPRGYWDAPRTVIITSKDFLRSATVYRARTCLEEYYPSNTELFTEELTVFNSDGKKYQTHTYRIECYMGRQGGFNRMVVRVCVRPHCYNMFTGKKEYAPAYWINPKKEKVYSA